MEIDEEALDIQLTKVKSDEGDRIVPQLVANIPIINVKTDSVEAKQIVKEAKKETDLAEEKPEENEVKEKTTKTAAKSKKVVKK